MVKITLLLFLAVNCPAAPDYQKFIEKYEGNKNYIYDDGNGIKSVGIGHRLTKNDKIKDKYTNNEINQFFVRDLTIAIEGVKKQIGIYRFDELPDDVKQVCVSLCFNVGTNGYSKFTLFNREIKFGNFNMAALDLFESTWFKQLNKRAMESIMILRDHRGITVTNEVIKF